MAKTPYTDLASETILAAHLSGLQHSINKVEETLNMKTTATTGHILNPVADQDDLTLRYRIYEGTVRNWLEDPIPVIKRNGAVVNSSEYTISPEHGVVVFDVQQQSTDSITFDGEYITSGSNVLDALKVIRSHRSGKLKSTEITAGSATNVLIAANQPDVFPFLVTESTDYTGIAVKVDAIAGTGARLAIYADDGDGYPGSLLLDAGTVSTTTTGWKEVAINITLEPGVYWLARNTDGGVAFGGFPASALMVCPDVDYEAAFNGDLGAPAAYRGSLAYGSYPATFPAGASYLSRGTYGAVWLRKA